MNTITLSSATRMTSSEFLQDLGRTQVLATPPTRPLPVWLPAPPAIRIAPQQPSQRSAQSFRPACAREFRLERAGMILLAVAGVLGIAYGFSCLIDLVQHWAVFTAGVGQLIQ